MEGWEIHQAFNDDASLARRNHHLTEENLQWSAGTKAFNLIEFAAVEKLVNLNMKKIVS